MADQERVPDYDLADELILESPEQYGALFEETRHDIISLLSERAATTTELADVLGKPKGTVGHHLNVLADAGLIRVVRTKRVRALEAKYYGRTARLFLYHRVGEAVGEPQRIVSSMNAAVSALSPEQSRLADANIRYARIPAERVAEWHERLSQLIVEFGDQPRAGQTTFALGYALYPTSRPPLPDDELPDDPTHATTNNEAAGGADK